MTSICSLLDQLALETHQFYNTLTRLSIVGFGFEHLWAIPPKNPTPALRALVSICGFLWVSYQHSPKMLGFLWTGISDGEIPPTLHLINKRHGLVVKRGNRRFCCETIHPTQKFISMNLLQISCMITWA